MFALALCGAQSGGLCCLSQSGDAQHRSSWKEEMLGGLIHLGPCALDKPGIVELTLPESINQLTFQNQMQARTITK